MAQKVIKRKSRRKAQYDNSRGLSSTVAAVDAGTIRSNLPDFSAGDTVKVHVKIKEGEKERIQLFEGTVIKRGNRGAGKSFIVRKISHGVGVERIFLESSPAVAEVEIVTRGKNALVVERGNVQALADAMKTLLYDPAYAHNLGKAGLETVKTEYDMNSVGRRIETELQQLVLANTKAA